MAAPDVTTIRVWDLPTRLFHWALVFCVAGSFVTIKLGGFVGMEWHARFGQITFGLILFRLIWGVVGPHYARFSQFVRGPSTIWAYLQGQHLHVAGHNPMGALSVIAMLLVFGFQATSGLFASEDVFFTSGSLAYLSSAWSSRLTSLHKLNEWPMIVLVGLHLVAIVWYRLVKKRRLVKAMITGNLSLPNIAARQARQAPQSPSSLMGALLLVAAITALTWWMSTLAPGATSFY